MYLIYCIIKDVYIFYTVLHYSTSPLYVYDIVIVVRIWISWIKRLLDLGFNFIYTKELGLPENIRFYPQNSLTYW